MSMRRKRGFRTSLPLALMLAAALVVAAPAAAADEPASSGVAATSGGTLAHLAAASRGAGPSLAPLGLVAAWLGALTLMTARQYRAARPGPDPLVAQLQALNYSVKPDLRALVQPAKDASAQPFGRLALRVLAADGLPHDRRRAAYEDAEADESERLAAPCGWFATIYQISTLIGLLAALGVLIDSFQRVAAVEEGTGSGLNGAIAAALVPSAVGVVVGIAAALIAEQFRQWHLRLLRGHRRLLLPLVDKLNDPPTARDEAPSPHEAPKPSNGRHPAGDRRDGRPARS